MRMSGHYTRLAWVALLTSYASIASALTLENVEFIVNPSGRVPLSALLRCTTDAPTSATLHIQYEDGKQRMLEQSDNLLEHAIPVLGLEVNRVHRIQAVLKERSGAMVNTEIFELKTEPLPEDFPLLRVNTARPRHMEPGITLIPTTKWTDLGQPDRTFGLILGVNAQGDVVWYYQSDHNIAAIEQLRNGNLLYHHGRKGHAIEIDFLGNVIHHWYARRMRTKDIPGAIPIDTDTIHHDVQELPNGNFLAISTEVRHFDAFPSSETVPDAPLQPAYVVGDVIVEYKQDGTVVGRWPLLDLLDPFRLGYDSLDVGFWTDVYNQTNLGHRAFDWGHANSVEYDPADNSILVSVYHQDTVFKFFRKTGKLNWIMSFPTGWRESWKKHLLYPAGEGMYPAHEHAAKVTPNGTILMFDNGTYRARPFDAKRDPRENFSRAVEYEVNPETMEFKQVWSYGGPKDEIFFSPFLGDTDWLPETGNILITDGGRVRAADDSNANHPSHGHKWAHIMEVTHDQPAKKVFDLVIDDPKSGWTVYRAERIPGFDPPK
jgi:hypothetical protein